MTSVYRDNARDGWRLQTYVRGVRRKLWIGAVSKKQADQVCTYVHAMKLAAETATSLDPHVVRWSNAISDRLANTLADWGLMEPRGMQAQSIHLEKWIATYFASAIAVRWAKTTRVKMEYVARLMLEHIGDVPLSRITEAHADNFAAALYAKSAISSSHAAKQIKNAKQILQHAVKCRLLDRNPFALVKINSDIDQSRKSYIDRTTAMRLLDKMSIKEHRVLFCLARFGGLRIPSESLEMTWDCIDWETHTMRVRSKKMVRHKSKEIRTVPIEPLLYRELLDLAELRGASGRLIATFTSDNSGTYRHFLDAAAKACGLTMWPKMWHNLRASCGTDWRGQFANGYVVDAWIGHSSRIADLHYNRVTAADLKKITDPTGDPAPTKKTKKRRGKPAS